MSDEGSQADAKAEEEQDHSSEATPRSTDGMEALLDQAEAELAAAGEPAEPTESGGAPLQLDEFSDPMTPDLPTSIDLLHDVDLDLRIELGRTHMRLEDVLHLRSGSVVALDRLAGDPVDVFVNDRLVAKGEVLVLNDNFCVRVTELVSGGKA